MSDYAQITDFSTKDALTTGDPEKLILGSDVDDELAAISVAIATKYDSGDIASQAQAEAETSNVVLVTPLRLANWADYNAGIVGDLQALADPNADRILGWDDSAGAGIGFTLSTGLTTSTTNLLIDTAVVPQLAAANTFTASPQVLSASQALFDAKSTGDFSGGMRVWTSSSHSGGFLAVPSSGFAGGTTGDIVAYAVTGGFLFTGDNGATAGFKLSSAGVLTTPNASAAEVGYKGVPFNSQSVDYTLVLTDAGKTLLQTGSSKTFTIPANGSVAFPVGTVITFIVNAATSCSIAITTDNLYLAGTALGTSGPRTLAHGGMATAVKFASTAWLISGAGLS